MLAAYLHDAANATRLLGDLADPAHGATPKLSLLSNNGDGEKRKEVVEEEFDGTGRELEQAVKDGDTQVLGWYLRDLSELLELTASALSNSNTRLDWRLKFKRRRPGRPIDPAKQETERAIEMRLRFGRKDGIKQESTVDALMKEYGVCRATIMRINKGITKPPKLKSQKKR